MDKLSLPKLLSREEMLHILQKEEYGFLPPLPSDINFTVDENILPGFCAGKAILNKITATCTINSKKFSFPFHLTIPNNKNKKHPFFVFINFRADNPDRYMPTEEIIDNGFAIFSLYYEDVTTDNNDFTNGLAGVLYENKEREDSDPGKIAMWAWALMRIMDYASNLGDVLDLNCSIVCGHSRLGKTALLAGALDERFKFVYSNDSGCSGAAITRNKQGEQIKDIFRVFPFWFCKNYSKYIDNEDKMSFDQHYLLASISPRKVLIGSASNDLWADPNNEMLSCIEASSVFKNGFIFDRFPAEIGDKFFMGDIGYHLREGDHYFSRQDWNNLIEFIKLHYKF